MSGRTDIIRGVPQERILGSMMAHQKHATQILQTES